MKRHQIKIMKSAIEILRQYIKDNPSVLEEPKKEISEEDLEELQKRRIEELLKPVIYT